MSPALYIPRRKRIERPGIIVPRRRIRVDMPSTRPRRRRIDTTGKVLQFLAPGWNDTIPSGVPFMAMRQNGSISQAIPEDDVGNGSREGGSGSGRSCCCNVCADCIFGTIADFCTATSSGITMGDCTGDCFNQVPPMGFDPLTSSNTSMFFNGPFAGTGYNKSGFTLLGTPPESIPPVMADDIAICSYSAVYASGEPDTLFLQVCDNTTCDPGSDIEGIRVVDDAQFPNVIWSLVKNSTGFTQDQTGTGGSTSILLPKGWLLQGILPLCFLAPSTISDCGPNGSDSSAGRWFLEWPVLFFLGFIDTSADAKVDCGKTLTFDNLITTSCEFASVDIPGSTGGSYDFFAAGSGGTAVVTPHIPAIP